MTRSPGMRSSTHFAIRYAISVASRPGVRVPSREAEQGHGMFSDSHANKNNRCCDPDFARKVSPRPR